MKFKSRIILPMLTVLTFGMVASTIAVTNYAKEDSFMNEADAGDKSTLHSNKMYIELYSSYGIGNVDYVYLHVWGTRDDNSQYIDTYYAAQGKYDGDAASGAKDHMWYVLYPDYFVSSNIKYNIAVHHSNGGQTEFNCYDTGGNKSLPANSGTGSNTRWIYCFDDSGTKKYSVYDRDFYRAITVDNDSTTCSVTGDFMGIQNECSHSDMVFTVANIPAGKVATLVQYEDADCTNPSKDGEFLLDSNSQKTINGGFKFTKAFYFKPKLYNILRFSLNGGSTWTDFTCDDPTAATINYTATVNSMTAGNEVQFKIGDTRVYPTLTTYGMNISRTGDTYQVQDTKASSQNLTVVYTVSSSSYTITSFGTKSTLSAGYYIHNITTGQYTLMEYLETSWAGDVSGPRKKMVIAPKSDESVRYTKFNENDKLYIAHSHDGSNEYKRSYVDGGVGSIDAKNYLTIPATAYYYIELRSYDNEDNYNKIYLENYSLEVTFDYNYEGSPEDLTVEVIRKHTFSAPDEPTRTGYDFAGWKDGEGNTWTFATDTIDDTELTLYAQWTAHTFTIMYSSNSSQGTGGSTTPQTPTYDDPLTLRTNGFTKKDYTFVKWNTRSDGQGVDYSSGQSLSASELNELYAGKNQITRLYAIWDANVYTITLNEDNPTSHGDTTIYQKYETGYYKNEACTSKITIESNAISLPSKTGYIFGGYYTEAGGNGVQYITPAGYLSEDASDSLFTTDGNLYAYWIRNITYSIVLNSYIGVSYSVSQEFIDQQSIDSVDIYMPNCDHLGMTSETLDAPVAAGVPILIKVSPAQLTENFTITYKNAGVAVPGGTINTNLATLIMAKYNAAGTTDNEKNLCLSILAYGNHSQKVFNYNVNNLAISYVPTDGDVRKTLNSTIASYSVNAVSGCVLTTNTAGFTSPSMRAGTTGAMVFKYIFSCEDMESHNYVVSVTGLANAKAEIKRYYETQYCINVTGIKPTEMNTLFTIYVKENDVTKFQMTYAFNQYLYVQKMTGDDYNKGLARATRYYYDCVDTVF